MIRVKELTNTLSTETEILVTKLGVGYLFEGKAREFFESSTYKSNLERQVIKVYTKNKPKDPLFGTLIILI